MLIVQVESHNVLLMIKSYVLDHSLGKAGDKFEDASICKAKKQGYSLLWSLSR